MQECSTHLAMTKESKDVVTKHSLQRLIKFSQSSSPEANLTELCVFGL